MCVLCSRSLCLASLMPQMNAVALAFTKAIAGALWAVLLGPNTVWSQRRYFKEEWGVAHVWTPPVSPSLSFLFRGMIGSQETCPSCAAMWSQAFPSLSRPFQLGHLVSKGLLLLGPFIYLFFEARNTTLFGKLVDREMAD